MSDIINIKTKSLNLINLIEISYGCLIEDTKDNHIFDKRINVNIIKNIIPFITSYFQKKPSIEIKTNIHYHNIICCYTDMKTKEIYQKNIKNYRVIDNTMIKEIEKTSQTKKLFPSLKKYDYQSTFLLYTWELEDGINLKLFVYKKYGMLDICFDVCEKITILDSRKIKINKKIKELSKIIYCFTIN